MVTLIKPQFEAGRENVGKGGIVRDTAVHREVLQRVIGGIAECGLSPLGLTFSPIKGADGNIEYLLYCCKDDNHHNDINDDIIDAIVTQSHTL
jgi:23S rRNA (cytidine1920-2'-O)/16S rRNA (cytidine1409-2'-O)-methyltransferase